MPQADDILCGEIGAPGDGRWSAPLRLHSDDLPTLDALVAEGIVETRAEAAGVSLAGVDHVGTVQLPSGRRLHIRPKVGDLVLLVLIGVDVALTASPKRLHAERRLPVNGRLGEPLETSLLLRNDGPRRLRGRVRDAWPPSAGLTPSW